MFRRDDLRSSKSVTRGTDFAELLLQTETYRQDVLRHIEGALRTPDHVHVGKSDTRELY